MQVEFSCRISLKQATQRLGNPCPPCSSGRHQVRRAMAPGRRRRHDYAAIATRGFVLITRLESHAQFGFELPPDLLVWQAKDHLPQKGLILGVLDETGQEQPGGHRRGEPRGANSQSRHGQSPYLEALAPSEETVTGEPDGALGRPDPVLPVDRHRVENAAKGQSPG